MQQSAHRFIAQYFMDHSDLMLDESFVSAETGAFKCIFTLETNKDAVKMVLEYLPEENEDNSWITVRGVIGQMGEMQNLCRIAKYFRNQNAALYTVLMEKHGAILILSRSFRVRNLDLNSMYELTYGLARMVVQLRQLMLPCECYLNQMRCQDEYIVGKHES